ncbi:nitrate- and nitrite sensing domain-containing protein [Alteromonas sp. ASW11-36]|uniref:Nitrate- and nitrite sensing domain-containing protein n=1 Tax=Alteromonas arenosi TaxID=3055817 RepID=A0ABT7SYL5_9ALTE|nr:nitrate- and nitrite sensing domain-containing protein [Alteromonas sp. ASW11-36]MDM7861279.1 nitrate- and nitrite sensing domain-containing protein [Alteromonas sp. ASW11-36]
MEITVLLILTIIAGMLVTSSRKRHIERLRQVDGIEVIKRIKNLIYLIQVHRGLSSALLKGDNSANAKLINAKADIFAAIETINATFANDLERWASIEDHWGRLAQQTSDKSVSYNFDQHTSLIMNVACFLEDVAESAYLTSGCLNGFDNVGYVWRELLHTTENVGQCRAIGTSVVVQKSCSSADKTKLNDLLQALSEISETTLQKLPYLPDEQREHDRLIKKTNANMSKLFTVIKTELLSERTITIDSHHYFDLATDTMTGINEIFEHQLKQVGRIV